MKATHPRDKTILFVNTFIPVAPLYEAVFPRLVDKGLWPVALLSQGEYRQSHKDTEMDFLADYGDFVWIPPGLRSHKRWCNILYWLLAPLKLIRTRSQAIVFLTQPPFFFVLGATIARLRKIPYAVQVMDLWPDALVELDYLRKDGLAHRLLLKWVTKAYNHARCVISVGRCMRDRLISQGVKPDKITVFYHWPRVEIHPVEREDNQFLKQEGLYEKFIILYSGNMGYGYSFDSILEAAKRLREYQDIVFMFVGRGPRRKEIEQAIASGQGNVALSDFVPQDFIAHSLSAADIHFLSLRPGFEGAIVPGKFYATLASKRPILYEVMATAEGARIIEEFNCGMVITPGDADSLTAHILHFYNDRKALANTGDHTEKALEYLAQPDLSPDAYVETLLRVMMSKHS
ncbi:MAG: glycosyltransferase family 4 protein [Fidelibacterota bacterium]|nr:MAG: glycosyltransferase family 4 protein [Candidatus Neomarinimicrobiota bacterium]